MPSLKCTLQEYVSSTSRTIWQIPLKRHPYLCTAIRLPITLHVLQVIKQELSRKQSFASLDNGLFWAAFTLVFYGFLHASEYTSPNPTHYLRQLYLLR
jgi:hypothetical protein